MITAVIVEDEFFAAQNLQRMIEDINRNISIVSVLQSVEESLVWFNQNKHPDIVFMDIHLADGNSFEIFEKIRINSSVIFTTAYDEYALKAFEVNSVDYLLKPIESENLERALKKASRTSGAQSLNSEYIMNLIKSFKKEDSSFKNAFLIPYKDKLIPVSVDNIAYVLSEFKMAKIFCFNGQKYVLDMSLDKMMQSLNPNKFYRVNRQYIVAHSAVKDMSVWFQGKLAINLCVPTEERIIISRVKSGEFKDWFLDNSE